MDGSGSPHRRGAVSSVRAQLAVGLDAQMTRLLPETVFATRTPCHERLVQVREAEFEQADRSVAVRCPGCSAIWQVRLYAPVVHWDQ